MAKEQESKSSTPDVAATPERKPRKRKRRTPGEKGAKRPQMPEEQKEKSSTPDVAATPEYEPRKRKRRTPSQKGVDEYPDVSEKSASVISIVRDVERELDVAYELKDALEADLATTREELSKVSSARAELAARAALLEGQAALVGPLREDIAFVEEERDRMASVLEDTKAQLEQTAKERDSLAERTRGAEESIEKLQRDKVNVKEEHSRTARVLEDTKAQLDQTLKERDSLAEQMRGAEEGIEKLQQEKANLERDVFLLEDKLTEMDRLREELAKAGDARRELESGAKDLTKRLEASSTSSNALESELATAREEVAHLRERLTLANESLQELRAQCDEQKTENRDVREANRRLEQTVRVLTARHEAASNEVEALRKALGRIHAAAAETTGRIRTRRHRLADGEQA